MDYKSLLLNYLSEIDATAGSIVYQPCDGLIEVCETLETKQELLNLVEQSDITLLTNTKDSVYQELISWSLDSDLLVGSSEKVLFCIPNETTTQLCIKS